MSLLSGDIMTIIDFADGWMNDSETEVWCITVISSIFVYIIIVVIITWPGEKPPQKKKL